MTSDPPFSAIVVAYEYEMLILESLWNSSFWTKDRYSTLCSISQSFGSQVQIEDVCEVEYCVMDRQDVLGRGS